MKIAICEDNLVFSDILKEYIYMWAKDKRCFADISVYKSAEQFLINGDLGTKDGNYPGEYTSCYGSHCGSYGNAEKNYIRLDSESNEETESYLRGQVRSQDNNMFEKIYMKYWYTDSDLRGSKNHFYTKSNSFSKIAEGLNTGRFYIPDEYINFERLYNNIIAEQNSINEGKIISDNDDGIIHIEVGGNYTIENISEVKEIIFDNFFENEDKLTIVTIKDSGNVNFPKISKDTGNYKGVPTNDYFGKKVANQSYEMDGLLPEEYYGNIVFSLPNANYIKLAPDAPFIGHLIAPNADVETEETQLAGCLIVNSFYSRGGTELHFYPINSDCNCVSSEYDSLSEIQKKKFNDYRLRESLGGDNTTIEKEILGDKAQYDKDVALFESLIGKCDNREIIINPETAGTITILLGLLAIAFTGLMIKTKKKNSQKLFFI